MGTLIMSHANNIINLNELFLVTTKLSSCNNTSLDLNRTVYDLWSLYENDNSDIFSNISIINFNCTNGTENYFQQMISFTRAVSIRVQILFGSIYFDYINRNHYRLNGFIIDSETFFTLSSITTNNNNISNACSTAEIAQDPLCLTNATDSVCTVLSNPWTYTCSRRLITTTASLYESTNLLETVLMTSSLNSWRLGLICAFSLLFILFLIFTSAFFYRRYRHSKHLVLAHVNLYDDVKFMQKTGIPQGQAFQRAATIIQIKGSNHTATSWIHDSTATNIARNDENYINIKPLEPYNQVTFVDHTKVHDPSYPSNTSPKPLTSINISSSPTNRINSTTISRSVSETLINSPKLITDGLQENRLNESDNITIDQSISTSPIKPNSPMSKQYSNFSFIDEDLTDEDAWMSILDVVNDELAKLDEQDRTRTLM